MFVTTPKFIRNLFPSIVWKNKNYENKIWLTFDDGPSPETTPLILDILKQENVKATFFLIGSEIEQYPKLFKLIIANGHIVANHSYSHKNGWKCNNTSYFDDIEKCQRLMPENKLFRPPYGKISPFQIQHLKKEYKIILWDVLSWDFHINSQPKKIKEHVLNNSVPGSIIVFHNNEKSLSALKNILQKTIKELKQKGFLFSTTW